MGHLFASKKRTNETRQTREKDDERWRRRGKGEKKSALS
jgi:hypothetical protein